MGGEVSMWKLAIWKRNREMIHFSGRSHSRIGILAAIIGILVVAGFITISILSSTSNGNGGLILGVIGFLLFGLGIFGFVLSYKAFKEKDIFYRFPIIGVALNGIMIVVFFILYILGIGG